MQTQSGLQPGRSESRAVLIHPAATFRLAPPGVTAIAVMKATGVAEAGGVDTFEIGDR